MKFRDFKEWLNLTRKIALGFLALGLAGLIDGPVPYLHLEGIIDFHQAVAAELFGIGITVVIIDWSNEVRANEAEKARLIRELSSSDNRLTQRAIKELFINGHISDGSLKSIDISRANFVENDLPDAMLQKIVAIYTNFSSCNLEGADLKQAMLDKANFKGAQLMAADLQDASVFETNFENVNLSWSNLNGLQLYTDNQLSKANMLWGAIMPDGTKYDGRFNLSGDYAEAAKWGLNISNQEDKLRFYDLQTFGPT